MALVKMNTPRVEIIPNDLWEALNTVFDRAIDENHVCYISPISPFMGVIVIEKFIDNAPVPVFRHYFSVPKITDDKGEKDLENKLFEIITNYIDNN